MGAEAGEGELPDNPIASWLLAAAAGLQQMLATADMI